MTNSDYKLSAGYPPALFDKKINNKIGYIHSILTGGTLDGPGIRYVIFFQMCPFRCKYCHNPDTWSINTLGIKTVDSIYKDIVKYINFFKFSGGGVTVSGGEPLLQAEFLYELFKKLSADDINIAIDTCGYIDLTQTVKEVLNLSNLILLDIKHLDSKIHNELTGKDNAKVLNFLKYLKSINKKVWIRQVLVPTYTTSEEYINNLILFLNAYKNIIDKIELLPYHKMGKEKWEKLGLKYSLNVEPPDKKIVDKIKKQFENNGYEVLVS